MNGGPIHHRQQPILFVLIGTVGAAYILSKIMVSTYYSYRGRNAALRQDLGKIVFVVGIGVYILGSFLWEIWKYLWF
jgi:hypothetical protein